MKFLLLFSLLFTAMTATSLLAKEKHYSASIVPKNMTVAEKKKRFFALLVPAVEDVYKALEAQYLQVKKEIKNHTNKAKIQKLKKKYNVKTDKELLIAIKPHPMSITLAQAAMESAWGTSRFFVQANNIFGVHSTNRKAKRVAAGEKTGNWRVWMSKYDTLDQAIRHYYFVISTTPEYKEFKLMNYENKPVMEIVKGLKEYSTRGDAYVKELASMIRYNKLTKYDTKVAK